MTRNDEASTCDVNQVIREQCFLPLDCDFWIVCLSASKECSTRLRSFTDRDYPVMREAPFRSVLRTMAASLPAFAVSAVPVVASAGAVVVAARVCDPTAELAVVVCAERPAASGRRQGAVVAFVVLAGVSARHAVFPGFAAGGGGRTVAGASVPSRD